MPENFDRAFIDTQSDDLKLFIADDQPILRDWLKSIAAELPHIRLVGEADTTLTTFRGIQETRPEVIILDIRMPGNGGLHVLSKIKAVEPAPIVIVFTAQSEPYYRELSLDIGADYFFNKTEEFDQIEPTLRQLQVAKRTWLKNFGGSSGKG